MPPPCCQIPSGPHGNFRRSLLHDVQQFSKYVGGVRPPFATILPDILTSGLHLEMKLWRPPPLAAFYNINDAQHNSWLAMSKRTVADKSVYPQFDGAQKCSVFSDLCHSFPHRSGCALLEYDQWILSQIIYLRTIGLKHAGLTVWTPPNKKAKPPALGSVGLSQKLINIYVKYEFSWQRGGQWQNNPPTGHFVIPYTPPFSPEDFLCALHAPIDRQILKALNNLAVGRHLASNKLLSGENFIQSSDGSQRAWSKLDCLRTYYGFQLVMRRIAMGTWPPGCECFPLGGPIRPCSEMFEKEFADGQKCQGPDWIEIANKLPDDVITATIEALQANVT